ncbi:MAG: hypothetical protein LBK41_08320 [Clostridiales bacterium]|nr:hypothetical protein [Clostridiales bacterium]
MPKKKLAFPRFLTRVPCRAVIAEGGPDMDGAETGGAVYEGRCVLSEKTVRVVTDGAVFSDARGRVYIDGDAAPGLAKPSRGSVVVWPGGANETRYSVIRADRPRNPDGSVNHTILYLL